MSSKTLLQVVCAAVLLSVSAFAVDGVVLVNQATIMQAGGFPYKITHPGSYKLTGNLTVTSANIGAASSVIEIDADNVTLDLNGFSIMGPNTCTRSSTLSPVTSCTSNLPASVEAIFSTGNNISILNGSVQGMSGFAIDLVGINEHIEGLEIDQNGGGISIDSGIVRRCIVSRNGAEGIDDTAIGANLVESNTVSFNRGEGISLVTGTASGNVVTVNGGNGLVIGNGLANANTLLGNTGTDLAIFASSISNHNNNCSGTSC